MSRTQDTFTPAEAACRLGVSPKALRLYEARGLLTPVRTEAGWRTYGPTEMARAAEIVALRSLGLSLKDIGKVLLGDPQSLDPALETQQKKLENQIGELGHQLEKIAEVRNGLAHGTFPNVSDLDIAARDRPPLSTAFDLPWPWDGERFELSEIQPLNFIVGPLFSGKTRFARALAESLPNAEFLGLDRLGKEPADEASAPPAIDKSAAAMLRWLIGDGAAESPALTALAVALSADTPEILVIDMVEDGLDQVAQEALMAYLRLRGPDARPLFLMTRSSAILDMTAAGPGEIIILCPANHSPPSRVMPYPGAPGYETVVSCLATPAVRARTKGVIAIRPGVQSA